MSFNLLSLQSTAAAFAVPCLTGLAVSWHRLHFYQWFFVFVHFFFRKEATIFLPKDDLQTKENTTRVTKITKKTGSEVSHKNASCSQLGSSKASLWRSLALVFMPDGNRPRRRREKGWTVDLYKKMECEVDFWIFTNYWK